MFVDAVLPNLVLFGLGQAAAWLYLRTGRFWLGTAVTVALWTLLDWWIVGRYLFGVPAAGQVLPLTLLQFVALGAAAAYGLARARRRLAAASRPDRFRAGMEQLLGSRLDEARATFRSLVRADPWDVAAWIALGDVHRRGDELRRARRCYRRAAGVDTAFAYRDLLRHRAALCARPARSARQGPGSGPPPTAGGEADRAPARPREVVGS